MRVIHVIDSLAGSGGAERGLVRELVRFPGSLEQRVVLLYDRNDLAETLEQAGIPVDVIGVRQGRGSRAWPGAAVALRRILREVEPDVIQSSLFLGNLVAELGARGLEVPVLANLVLSGDPELLAAYQPQASTWRARMLRSIAGWAARPGFVHFRALTEDVRQTNAALLRVDPGRVTVIPRSVVLPPLEPGRSRADLGLPEGTIVVNVARQAPQKGHTLLLRAFAKLTQRVPDVRLVMAGGPGESTAEIGRSIADLDLGDAVTMVGHIEDLDDYLAHSSVFAFSSLMEGLGTAVLEAMAAALPVVAFDIPPVREATVDGRFGSLVPAGDIDGFARAIEEQIGAGGRRMEARQWVAEQHDPELIAGRVEALLRSLPGRVNH